MSVATKKKPESSAESLRAKACESTEQGVPSMHFLELVGNLVKVWTQNIPLHSQIQGQADSGCIVRSDSHPLYIILMIMSEFNWKAKMPGSYLNFTKHKR